MKSWALGAMVLSMVAVAACDGEDTTTSTSGDTGGSGGAGSGGATTGAMTTTSGSSTTTGSNTTTTGSNTSSTGTGGDTCADASDCTACPAPSATDNVCGMCCAKANPDSQKKFIAFVANNCICAATSPCFTACGGMGTTMPAVCADPNATVTMGCNTCLNGIPPMDACINKASMECLADPVCKLLGVCVNDCAG